MGDRSHRIRPARSCFEFVCIYFLRSLHLDLFSSLSPGLNIHQASPWSSVSGVYTNTTYTASDTDNAENNNTVIFAPIEASGGMVILADGGCDDPDAGDQDQYFRLVDGTDVEVNG